MSAGKFNFTSISTVLLLSIVALPVSVVAFTVIYVSSDPFWSWVWMGAVLPTIWAIVVIQGIVDVFRRRSRRQVVGALLLLAPTALLFAVMLSPRFWLHQLFTFRPLDLQPVKRPFTFLEKFSVCEQHADCTSRRTATETRNFNLTKIPDGCCFLRVVNGPREHKAENIRVALNGQKIDVPLDQSVSPIVSVALRNENELSVQLTGTPDAYVYVAIWRRRENSK